MTPPAPAFDGSGIARWENRANARAGSGHALAPRRLANRRRALTDRSTEPITLQGVTRGSHDLPPEPSKLVALDVSSSLAVPRGQIHAPRARVDHAFHVVSAPAVVVPASLSFRVRSRLPPVMVGHERSRIVPAAPAGPGSSRNVVGILSGHTRCASPKQRIELTDGAHHVPSHRHIGAVNEARRHEGAAGNLGSCRRIPHTDPRVTRVVKNDAPADEPVTTFFEDVDERPQVILPGTAIVVGEGQDVAARLRKAHVAGAGQPRHGSPQAPHRKRSVSGESIEEKGCRIRGRVVDDNEFPTARGRVERGHTGQEVGQPCRPVSRAHDQRHSQRHDLAWQQDAEGYRGRINRFLDIAARHHIRPLFVLFDSCWDPDPKVGRQQAPRPFPPSRRAARNTDVRGDD